MEKEPNYSCQIAALYRVATSVLRRNWVRYLRLAWHVHTICPFSCTFLARFLHNLAHILQEMVQDYARVAARIITCISCTFLQDLARIGARLCKNRARKGTYRVHVPSKSCMQDSCNILAQSCMILQVRFCWAEFKRGLGPNLRSCKKFL